MEHFDLLIIGNGPAAHRLLCDLAERDGLPISIGVIGEEARTAYNRILLSPLLAAEIDLTQIELRLPEIILQRTQQFTGCKVSKIDAKNRLVVDELGRCYGYSQLVIATGARPIIPDMEGVRARGIMAFRSTEDVERMQQIASRQGKAVVIGGGFLGLEAAEGLRKLGMDVTLVHRSSHLLNRQLDTQAAQMLRTELESRGLDIRTDTQLSSLATQFNQIKSVRLSDGSEISLDLLVFATGIQPNKQLAQDAGLEANRGIEVDAAMRTSDPSIFALGECIEFEGATYGLVAPIWRQSEVLATTLSGGQGAYIESATATQLKVSGVDLYSCGEIATSEDSSYYLDSDAGHYRRFWFRDERLIGAVLYGDTSLGPKLTELIQAGQTDPGFDLLLAS